MSAIKAPLKLQGDVIEPGDPGYEEARKIWNGWFDKRPALIARCAGVADVIAALDHAREHDLLIAVRGGGHSLPGHSTCDDGIVIDLSPMKGIRVDASTRTARAQGGVTWGEFDRETQAFGLATTGGQITHTGIAGLTLGGGVGWLMRHHGLTCDNLVSADVVTPDGRLVTASEDENPDLLWGLRGGGGNFGIVTSFEYRLHELGQVLAGPIVHRADRAAEGLRFVRDFLANAPNELTTFSVFATCPPHEPFPAHLWGQPVFLIVPCWSGPLEDGEAVLQPLRGFGPPEADLCGPMPYTVLQSMLDGAAPWGLNHYGKSDFLGGLDDGAIDTLVEAAGRLRGSLSQIMIGHMGGAVSDVDRDATAFSNRGAEFFYHSVLFWDDPDEETAQVSFARGLWSEMRPYSAGAYVNFLDVDEADRLHDAYAPETYERLVALKREYDPENRLRLNQNIPPA
jgi:FAD binding domain/Berberine and berberine like